MSLPRGDEYNLAIQTPTLSFSDSDLRSCQVETTPLGLPKPYSGGFTTTYKMLNSKSSWAVRCFTREIKDLQQRYQSIGNFISRNNSSYLVDAKYVQNGIKINGIFYPIIKMKWLEGEPLNNFISNNYSNKTLINSILNEFVKLVNTLENSGIAHGDLQHGNIMVKNNQLFLIDYDGMFLPDLSHLKVNELGHPNYQHPQRNSDNYNNKIDRFAAIIIYTGLKAISIEPNIWKKFDNGENILFKGQDFINPDSSQLVKELLSKNELQQLAKNLTAICKSDFERVPTLKDFISGVITATASSTATSVLRSAYLVLDGRERGNLLEHIGERVTVVGKIGGKYSGLTRYNDPYLFLNIGIFPNHTFTIVCWSEILDALRRKGINPNDLIGDYVSVTGVLSVYENVYNGFSTRRPQIALDNAIQLQILPSGTEMNQLLRMQTVKQEPVIVKQQIEPKKTINDETIFNELYKNKTITEPKVELKTPIYNQPKINTYNQKVYKLPTLTPKNESFMELIQKQPWLIRFILLFTVGPILGAISFAIFVLIFSKGLGLESLAAILGGLSFMLVCSITASFLKM